MKCRISGLFVLALVLTACSGLPAYQAPPPGVNTALVDTSRVKPSTICHAGKFYSVGAVKGDRLVVPADGRVGLFAYHTIADYQVTYTCMPGVSFQPKAGGEYLINLENDSKGCTLETYRKEPGNRLGLQIETGAARGEYCN